MAKFGNNYIRALIHKTGLAAQHKHDAVGLMRFIATKRTTTFTKLAFKL
jgi:hypothetical protein